MWWFEHELFYSVILEYYGGHIFQHNPSSNCNVRPYNCAAFSFPNFYLWGGGGGLLCDIAVLEIHTFSI